MNLNEQIYRIKNLMYEQDQVQLVTNGDLNDSSGQIISLETKDNDLIGKTFLTRLENATNVDPAFIKMFDESKFQTIPLNYDNSLFLHSLDVNDQFKKQGYGTQIMKQSHDIASNNGYKYVTLIMDKGNKPAENLYNKLGYKKLNSDENVEFYFVEL
jgi:ribosomal protein S18 acetylase RimI-like enzyme